MIVMNVKLDNFLLFRKFEINMAYPKKIVGSGIPEEHLKDYPNFRYKKLKYSAVKNAPEHPERFFMMHLDFTE